MIDAKKQHKSKSSLFQICLVIIIIGYKSLDKCITSNDCKLLELNVFKNLPFAKKTKQKTLIVFFDQQLATRGRRGLRAQLHVVVELEKEGIRVYKTMARGHKLLHIFSGEDVEMQAANHTDICK